MLSKIQYNKKWVSHKSFIVVGGKNSISNCFSLYSVNKYFQYYFYFKNSFLHIQERYVS